MKIKISIIQSEGASEFGESWDEYQHVCKEHDASINNHSDHETISKIIEIADLSDSLKNVFFSKLNKHLNDRYLMYVPNELDLIAKEIYSNINLSRFYTHGAVKGLFSNLNYIQDPAGQISSYLTAKEGRILASTTKQSAILSVKEAEQSLKDVISFKTL